VPSPSDPTSHLAIRGLRKRFGDRAVLAGVDLDVEPGSIVLLAGSNGSGKTTLLRCIAGLARYEGRIALDGLELRSGGAGHPDVGYLPQTPGPPAWATGAEVLALFAKLRRCAPDSVTLPDGFLPPLDQPVGQLSGGQRQRLAFAVSLLGDPSLLLLDEPAANLDDDGRAAMVEVLEGLREIGTSVLVAAPSPGDLNGLPDRVVRLVDGRRTHDSALHLVRDASPPPSDPSDRPEADVRDPQEVSA
jgi:ABC-type multidrug transport system ATPase subunit